MLKKKKFVEWLDIISINRQYQYLPPERILEIIRELSNELHLRVLGEIPEMILLKKE